jgi:transposase-like protein
VRGRELCGDGGLCAVQRAGLAGSVVSCAVLRAFRVDYTGQCTVLGVSVSLSQAEVHGRNFFTPGSNAGVLLWVSDDLAGLQATRQARFPETHRRPLRTSNLREGISQQSKRRTRVASLFPNEAALFRLVSAVLMETSKVLLIY